MTEAWYYFTHHLAALDPADEPDQSCSGSSMERSQRLVLGQDRLTVGQHSHRRI
jgi:hypothetical protein